MKSLSGILILLFCFSCNDNPENTGGKTKIPRRDENLVVKADLIASYTNFSNPRDRNYYHLVDVKLINYTNKECEFYTLICGSLVNIVTDSRQVSFLYHNCTADLAATIKLHPQQEYSVNAILVRSKYNSAFNARVRFGFIICKPKPGPLTNHEIVTNLKAMREKQENVIWSEPVTLTATNSNSYEIRNIIDDSALSTSN